MVSQDILAKLVPIDSLSAEHVERLAQSSEPERFERGTTLFRQGEEDHRTIYLLQGEVELGSDGRVLKRLSGGTPTTRHPLAPFQPRQVTASARSEVLCLRFRSEVLDTLLTWDQTQGYIVDDLGEEGEGDSDWMTRILHKEVFFRIPPPNIQAMFQRMEAISVRAGEPVIEQGLEGDYYYIIKHGRARVTRRTRSRPDGVLLATLGAGDSFGEDALISDSRRNATVTMLEHGELMRLAKKDFLELLNAPLLDWIDYAEGTARAGRGAIWLDVRLPSEFAAQHIEGSINLPFHALRMHLDELDPAREYLVVCDTGSRSSAASYLLSERGFRAFVLRGGLSRIETP